MVFDDYVVGLLAQRIGPTSCPAVMFLNPGTTYGTRFAAEAVK